MNEPAPTPLDHALARLDAWLETLRGPQDQTATGAGYGCAGYGGPVVHWWRSSLLFTGPAFDWRYEGIILGYLALWQRTAASGWLAKARRGGDDLLAVQLPSGHFPASNFEINPAAAGTPHEAAVDLALLRLAAALRQAGDPAWEAYLAAAALNLRRYYLEKLWDPQARFFRDHPQLDSFVPNKAATAAQACFAWSELSGDPRWAEQYALPTLERVLAHQHARPGPLHGAILQNSFGRRGVPKYMPYYNARCIPALLQAYDYTRQERFLAAADQAMRFILHQQAPPDGLLPALYPARQANRWPRWRAALGDVLLAADLLRPHTSLPGLDALQAYLLAGQDESGGIQTASGFQAQPGGIPGHLPDFRDLLHVAGWCDKAFHWLAQNTSPSGLPPAASQEFQADCLLGDMRLSYFENAERVQAICDRRTVYLWIKGESWAREAAPAFWYP